MKGLLLAGLLALIGCGLFESESEEEPPPEESNLVETLFSVKLNGESWKVTGASAGFACIRPAGLTLGVGGGIATEQRWPYNEALSLEVAYEGAGTYTLVKPDDETLVYILGARYLELDGEIATTAYDATDDPDANQITITRYDPNGGRTEESQQASSSNVIETAGIMEGTFSTTVVVRPEDAEPEEGEMRRRRPDTLRFTEGRFRVGVVDVQNAVEQCGSDSVEQREQ